MSQVMVSIYVATYNHEDYIVRALDSILMQKTQYSYEVFVGEDCSTDGTRRVLQQWEREHPGVFTILYREHNLQKTDCPNGLDLKLRCRGKYIIALEGDDFWTDPEKLQKQVDFLEAHPEYYAVAHNCLVVGADSQPNGETYPQCQDEEYTLRHFASNILPGQLTTLLYRNYMTDPDFDRWLTEQRFGPGDRRLYFSLACQGRVYCMQQTMSAYRHITAGGSSFSATNRYRYEKEEAYCRALMEFAHRQKHREAIGYAEMLYLGNIRYALRKGLVSGDRAREDLKRISHKAAAAFRLLRRDINHRLLHKTLYA